MDDTEQRSLIWRVIAVTTCCLALLTAIVVVFCAIFIPKKYGDFITALGFKNAGLVSYEYHYSKTKDINDLYYLNIKSILAGNNKYIKKSYEQLSRLDDYYDFVKYVENSHVNESVSKLAMVFVSNEDDYLKKKYITALYNLGEDAFSYAYQDFERTSVTNIETRYNFVLSAYISIATESELRDNITDRIANAIDEYKDKLVVMYSRETATDDVTKYRLSVIVYRIMDVLSAMKILNEKLDVYDIDKINALALSMSEDLMSLTK